MAVNWKDRSVALKPFPGVQQRAIERASTKQAVACSTAAATANANVTLTPHTQLFLPLQAGTHLLRLALYLSIANAAHNLKFDLNGGTLTAASALAAGTGMARFSLADGTSLLVPVTALSTAIDGATTNAWIFCTIDMTLVLDGDGTVALQYCQSVSGASASTIGANSSMHAFQVA